MNGPTHIVPLAASLAIQAHGDQTYGKDRPYVVHLSGVAEATTYLFELTKGAGLVELLDATLDELLATAWLHDSIEDTRVRKTDIIDYVCAKVAALVELLSDPEMPGASRDERKPVALANISTSTGATLVKMADRKRNHEETIANGSVRHARTYVREYPAFKGTLEPVLPVAAIWMILDAQVSEMRNLLITASATAQH